MKWRFKINKHNSTVCGYPGRDFDWSKFCWDGSEIYTEKYSMSGCAHKHERKSPLPFVDDGFIAPNCQYLHVPYNWQEDCTVYRVRPNTSMYAGKIFRGHRVKSQKAIQNQGVWYWKLELERGK